VTEGSTTIVRTIEDLERLVGRTLGPTEWVTVDQSRIDAFADVTDDHQWIHVDPERAVASPFGSTIAHGLLTLSFGPRLVSSLLNGEAFSHAVNYGYERVRFPAPLPSGARVRMKVTVVSCERPAPGGAQVVLRQTIYSDRTEKPVCVADAVIRYSGEATRP
jgi:acyl dehydratase